MSSTRYSRRRQQLRQVIGDGAILIMGADEAPRNYRANVYPFRQDSHFLYYVGVSQAGMAALLLPDGEELLFGAPPGEDDLIWHGPHPTLDDHAAAAGFARRADRQSLGTELARLRAASTTVHYLPPYRGEGVLALAELLGTTPREVGGGASGELVEAVAAQRSVKEDEEIAEIENALECTAAQYRAAWSAMAPGRTEAEVAAALQAAALAHDRQQAFNPIVSVRGEVLHNTSYGNTLQDGDLLLIDSGAESPRWYASDITRTAPVSGRFSERQREIYEVVLAAQTAVIDEASPTVDNRHLHLLAARTIVSGLKDLGLMQGDVDEAVAAGAHALFFPHGIGHMLGQDVHDMEDLGDIVGYPRGVSRSSQFGLAALRLARRLEPGFVITVEPGVYFIPALIERWRGEGLHREFIRYERLTDYVGFGGVRIEDDIVITDGGCRVLGPGIPKTPVEVEQAIGELAGR